VDIRLPEAQVWLRPQAMLASDIETIHLGDYGPAVTGTLSRNTRCTAAAEFE